MVNQSFTFEELKSRCEVPEADIKEFLSCREAEGEKSPRFSEEDIEQLGEFLALGSLGFSTDQRRDYLKLSERNHGTAAKMRMLGNQRRKLLDRVHELEKKISRIDYMKHELGNGPPEGRAGNRGNNRSRRQGRGAGAESGTKLSAAPGPEAEAKP